MPKIPPFPSPPTFNSPSFSLHCLDAIQMFFFSTPLWREPTPIVHKINPMVPADPAQTHNARTNRVQQFHGPTIMHTQSQTQVLGYVTQQGKLVNIATTATLGNTMENPSSGESMLITNLHVLIHTHPPFSLSVSPSVSPQPPFESPLRPQLLHVLPLVPF